VAQTNASVTLVAAPCSPSTDLRETVRKDVLSSHLQLAGPTSLAKASRGWLARMSSSSARAGQGSGSEQRVRDTHEHVSSCAPAHGPFACRLL
jgi:hypothetical protein